VPPYCILHDSVLIELVKAEPTSVAEASTIKGVGPAKLKNMMPKFIDAIQKWKKTQAIF
jgi:superfamily II DNA helicase RecQ